MKTNPNDPINGGTWAYYDEQGNIQKEGMPSMTKREYMATVMMGAMLHYCIMHKVVFQACAEDAVNAADELIIALNRTVEREV